MCHQLPSPQAGTGFFGDYTDSFVKDGREFWRFKTEKFARGVKETGKIDFHLQDDV